MMMRFLPLAVLVSALSVLAQDSRTGAIRGQVLDESGAAVAGAEVRLLNANTGFKQDLKTDAGGRYLFAQLPLTGSWAVECTAQGFQSEKSAAIAVRGGEITTVDFKLRVSAGGRESVTVFGSQEGVRSDSPALGITLSPQRIENTPVANRRLTNLVLLQSAVRPARGTGDLFLNQTLFVVNGNGRRQTSFSVDGSTGDDAWGRQTIFTNVPLVAVEEVSVMTSGFSPEFGRTTGALVNVNTRSGTNDQHVEAVVLWRPGGIQARAPLANQSTRDDLWQGSGAWGGALRKDKTFYFLSGEYSSQYRDSFISSPLATGIYRGEYKGGLGLARLDHQINSNHRAGLRLSLDKFSDTNPADAVGALTLPSAGRIFERATYGAQAFLTSTLSPRYVNEARVQYQLGSPITQFTPVKASTQYVRPGLATEGESRQANLSNRQVQLSDAVSATLGAHQFRFGGDLIYSNSGGYGQEFGSGFLLGQFTLRTGVTKPIDQLTAADMQRYQQSFGNPSYRVTQWIGSLYFHDVWRVTRTLTLNGGLRWERQSLTDDTAMISPRFGFAWNPMGSERTVIRGGYGLYYSQVRANIAAGYRIGGPEGVYSFSAAPGQIGFPNDLKPLPAPPSGVVIPARDITVRVGDIGYLSRFFDVTKLPRLYGELLNPRTQMASLGFERRLPDNWILSVDAVLQRTSRIDRPLDLNAPAPFIRTSAGQTRSATVADATRPILPIPGGYRRILAQVNDGNARYDGLQVNLNRRFARRFATNVSYTWANAINTVEPDVPGQDPNDANLLGRWERAQSLLNHRHRATVSTWWSPGRGFSLGGVAMLASARPFNVSTGTDNNGDGSTADRPVRGGSLLGRNSGQGTPLYDVQPFVQKQFKFAERYLLEFRFEAFNIFNRNNIVGRNTVWGNADAPVATFGQPLAGIANVDSSRQFQTHLRFRF
jgi:hypothetical protein